jgi:hypothetical protein
MRSPLLAIVALILAGLAVLPASAWASRAELTVDLENQRERTRNEGLGASRRL